MNPSSSIEYMDSHAKSIPMSTFILSKSQTWSMYFLHPSFPSGISHLIDPFPWPCNDTQLRQLFALNDNTKLHPASHLGLIFHKQYFTRSPSYLLLAGPKSVVAKFSLNSFVSQTAIYLSLSVCRPSFARCSRVWAARGRDWKRANKFCIQYIDLLKCFLLPSLCSSICFQYASSSGIAASTQFWCSLTRSFDSAFFTARIGPGLSRDKPEIVPIRKNLFRGEVEAWCLSNQFSACNTLWASYFPNLF